MSTTLGPPPAASQQEEVVAARQRDVLARIVLQEAVEARLFATRMRLRAEMDALWEKGPEGFEVLELAGTARIGQVRAATQLSDGRRLVEVFPVALGLLEMGVMFRETAVLLLTLTRNCTEAVQAEVDARISAKIAALNTADARKQIERAVLQAEADVDLDLTRERLERARRDRTVWTSPGQDGVLEIGAVLPAIDGRRWVLDFEELVRAQKVADLEAGVVRSQSQRRADVFADLPTRLLALVRMVQQGRTEELLALAQLDPDLAEAVETLAESDSDFAAVQPLGPPVPMRLSFEQVVCGLLRLRLRDPAVLNVHVPMATILELDHRSGWLDGYGPVAAELIRLLVPVAGLRRVFVDATSGVPLGLDPVTHPPLALEFPTDPHDQQDDAVLAGLATAVRGRLLTLLGPATVIHQAEARHDPSPASVAFVELRDQTCTGIGCSASARRSDKDHEVTWPQGSTAVWNLSSKSPRCHHAKHGGWDVTRGSDGSTVWTSPLGHAYSRPGVWEAPTQLAEDLQLPTPRLTPSQDQDPNDPDPWAGELDPGPDMPIPARPTRGDTKSTHRWDRQP